MVPRNRLGHPLSPNVTGIVNIATTLRVAHGSSMNLSCRRLHHIAELLSKIKEDRGILQHALSTVVHQSLRIKS